MRSRDDRLKAIKRIIKQQRVESQEILLTELQKQGFNVTQATLSRDLKLLKVGKISDGWHGYYYTVQVDDGNIDSDKAYIQDLQRGFLSIEFSGHLGVIKTLQGHANSVALSIDRFDFHEILGTVAGDDTIIVVLREGHNPTELVANLRSFIPDIDL